MVEEVTNIARQPRRAFDEGFKAKAVQRVLDGETIQAVADDIGVHVNVLRGWRSKDPSTAGGYVPQSPAEDTQEDLRRENALLRAELEYMRKRESILRR